MSYCAEKKGVAGTIIDGVCRDVPVVRELQYPIFTKSTYMVTGKDRVYVDAVNAPVSISDVQVLPGDLIVADDSGALVVPFSMAEDILREAQEIEAKEESIRAQLREGSTLAQARKNAGYHTLQTRR